MTWRRRMWRRPRLPKARTVVTILLGLVAVVVVLAVVLASFSTLELRRFAQAEAHRRVLVYSAGQRLSPGVNIGLIDLAGILGRLGYVEVASGPGVPGQFRRAPAAWELTLRGGEARMDAAAEGRVRIEMEGPRIARLLRNGQPVESVELEGEVLADGSDQSGEDHRPVRLGESARVLVNAVLAAEDHRFFDHQGLDARGLVRAAWTNLRAGRVRQGGSTITQQLVKIRLLAPERTLARKLQEAWLATLVELRYSKSEILEAYLNEVYLGQSGALAIRGVGAASRAYFAKEPHQLTAGEAALLAGMLRAPNTYSPVVSPARARERRDAILARMRSLRLLDAAAFARAKAEPLRALVEPGPGQTAPYFADHVRQEIEGRFDANALRNGRVTRVLTTLDPVLQRFAEDAMARGMDRLETNAPRLRRSESRGRLQAALVALDPATGEIRALVGGRDYRTSQFNRVTHGRRQPGSAFKPFVYLAALRARSGGPLFTAASRVQDAPLTLQVGKASWTPRNDRGRYEGRVSVRRALEQSLNTATVRVAQAAGLPAVIETARGLGITSGMTPVPAVALGAFEVSPLELARAYAAFANGGIRPAAATSVRALYEARGHRVEARHGDTAQGVLSPAEAYLMTSLLAGVVQSGTGSSLRSLSALGEIAGKTGTTNEGRDAWFVGYSSRLLAVVWVGFDQEDAHGLAGAQAAIPIWADFMKQALAAYPAPPFAVPGEVTVLDIDAATGKRATAQCPLVAREVFLTGTEPPPCAEHNTPPADRSLTDRILSWWERLGDSPRPEGRPGQAQNTASTADHPSDSNGPIHGESDPMTTR